MQAPKDVTDRPALASRLRRTSKQFHRTVVRAELEERRRQLEADLAHFEAWSMTRLGFGHALVDDGSTSFDQATQLTLRYNTERLLAQVASAIARLEAGVYGWCEGCGQAIDAERLRAVIDARLCVTCQRVQERSPLGRLVYQPPGSMALSPA